MEIINHAGKQPGGQAPVPTRVVKKLALRRQGGVVDCVAFSPDGRWVVTGGDDGYENREGAARVWSAKTGKVVKKLLGNTSSLMKVLFSPGGHHLLTVATGVLHVWDTTTWRQRFQIGELGHMLTPASFSPDGLRLIVPGSENFTLIWDLATGRKLQMLKEVEHGAKVLSAAFSADGMRVVTGNNKGVATIWDARSGRSLLRLPEQADRVSAVLFSPDGKTVLTSTVIGPSGRKAGIYLWDTTTGTQLRRLDVSSIYAGTPYFSPDGSQILTVYDSAETVLWDAKTGAAQATLGSTAGNPCTTGQFSPDGRLIATTSAGKDARIWNARTGKLLCTVGGQEDGVDFTAFSPDSRLLIAASSYEDIIQVWGFS